MNYKPTPALQKWWNDNCAKMRNDSSFTKATIVWNAATAAATDAAPQVVADERMPEPFFYYRSNADSSVAWGEDCVCIDNMFDEDVDPEESAHCGKVYSEARMRAALAASTVSTPGIPDNCAADPATAQEIRVVGNSPEFEGIKTAPVQAQEPTEGRPCPYCGITDGAHDKAYPHPHAPVQPVAVPDGAALVNAMCKAGQMNDHGRRTLLNGEEIGFDLPSLLAIVNIAAPAAQATVTDTGPPELRDHLKIAAVYGSTVTLSSAAAAALYRAMTTGEAPTAAQGDAKDAERMEFIENGTFDLSCYNDHDDDVYWNVIEHHMAAPIEREIGWGNTARQAIDAAIAASKAAGSAP